MQERAVDVLRASGAAIWGVQITPVVRIDPPYSLKTAAAVSGGVSETAINPSQLPEQAARLMDRLLAQSVMTFEAPATAGKGELRVGIKRPGATIAAPAWITASSRN